MIQNHILENSSSDDQPIISGILPLLIALLTTKSEDLDSN